MPLIIAADELKKSFPNYDPARSEDFHSLSAKLADKWFDAALKIFPSREVAIMSGGAASGKTEFLTEYLSDFPGIIFDGTFARPEGARIKIEKILEAKKTVKIFGVLPEDLRIAFTAFLHRERKFSDDHFYRTHAGARRTLLFVAKEWPHIQIEISESSYDAKKGMVFKKLDFGSHQDKIEFLNQIQYTEEDIIKKVTSL